jgi:hypothetical protein
VGLLSSAGVSGRRSLQSAHDTTPPANLQLPALPRLPAPSVTRAQHLSETLDPITGAPINLNVEDAPYLEEAFG